MMRVFGGVALALVLAALFAFVGAAILETADVLPVDVQLTLSGGLSVSPIEIDDRAEGGLDLTIVDGPPTGAAAGIQMVLLGVLLGGVPMALIGIVLAWFSRAYRRTWSGAWAQVFLGGFVFQLSSLCITLLLFLLMLLAFADLRSVESGDGRFAGGLLVSITCSAAALGSWRTLRQSVSDQPISVVTREPSFRE
jgi:hypothetical protein